MSSAATVGLCEAVRDYDPDRGSWSTFAVKSMENALLNEARRTSGPVRTPSRCRVARTVSIDEDHGLTTGSTLAHELRDADKDDHTNKPRSLLDVLATCGATPEQLAMASEAHGILDTLGDRERDVVARRIMGETLAEIGERIGVTRERVRQIELHALRLLRKRYFRGM